MALVGARTCAALCTTQASEEYRMVDGGYADNTAMLSNVAQMQRDCTKAGDCSDLSLVIFNAVGHSSNSTGLSSDNIFSYSDDTSKNNTMPLFIEPYVTEQRHSNLEPTDPQIG